MNVAQLIDLLSQLDPDTDVRMRVDSGDYWRTVLAKPIHSVDHVYVNHDPYHDCDAVQSDDADIDYTDRQVVVLY